MYEYNNERMTYMRTHPISIQSDDEYQQIASLVKEKLQAFYAIDLDSAVKIDIAFEIREYSQWLTEYDKKMSRQPQHEHELNHINEFLQKRKKAVKQKHVIGSYR